MVRVKTDLTNKTFGYWLVLNQTDDYIEKNGKHIARWLCKCKCGNIKKVIGKDLKSNKSKSCGCYQREIACDIGMKNKKYNKYDLSGEYGIGYTTNGEEFYFDLDDYDKIKNYCWFLSKDKYVVANSKNRYTILMHSLIMNNNNYIDHKNHICFDNRKINLRIVTIGQNNYNRKKSSRNTSGVVGVSWDKKANKWVSRIGYCNREIILGWFIDFNEAVKVRKQAEEKYFGEYSYDNSVKELS